MMSLLAIIGIICILMFISKALKKLGTFLENIAETIVHIPQYKNAAYKKIIPKKKCFKNTDKDDFHKQIQKEIEDIIKEGENYGSKL